MNDTRRTDAARCRKPADGEAHRDDLGLSRLGDLLEQTGLAPDGPRDRPPVADTGRGVPSRQGQSAAAPTGWAAGAKPGVSSEPLAYETESIARRVAELWPGIVGEEAAANSYPVQFKRGRLVVSTSSPAWAQSLQFMGEAIRGQLNASVADERPNGCEEDPVKTIFFRHAGWERPAERPSGRPPGRRACPAPAPPSPAVTLEPEPSRRDLPRSEPAPPGPPEPGLTVEQRDVLAQVEDLDVPVELRDAIRRAMRAAFVREERD